MEKINNLLFSAKYCGIKKKAEKGRRFDVGLAVFNTPTRVSAVFTKNKIKAAPVIISKNNSKNLINAIIVNSGNANACNGEYGILDAVRVTEAVSREIGVGKDNIFICSTGVIGERLKAESMERIIPELVESADESGFDDFAESIMTTDTFTKTASEDILLDGKKYKMIGTSKGSGMIMPNMATMLAFIFTDIPIERRLADIMFKECVDVSFNSVTVDGDTSTNDTATFFYPDAPQALKWPSIKQYGTNYNIVKKALLYVCMELAKMIAADGEGATKLIRITVENAYTEESAKKTALTVANSPLFKTMITGEDLNLGRIMAAIGRSPVRMKPGKIDVYIGDKIVVENSVISGELSKTEERALLSPVEIDFKIDLNCGKSSRTVLTCNLTKEYIDINASYRS
ncbi:MAG TPA: bifunctional glutamate N-acetyltransferase/amino-acid acetyltransferase ArgJ [bacterium]|nr:bifunctional glutamate N-acetyltransferase/amino-acid acetyltransferase ArgJ [bacterium]